MSNLKISIQKSGRLSEKSLLLLTECGIKISNSDRKLKSEASNFPMEALFLRDNDIPQYVEQGVADIGILGENEVWESEKEVVVLDKLGFAHCRLSLAIPKEEIYTDLSYFEGKKIATSYPKILKKYFADKKINIVVEEISGSVEIATGIGLADAIFDIVSTGSTLVMNGLKEVEVLAKSQAVLIAHKNLSAEKQTILDQLRFRMKTVKNANANKYILMNAPNDRIDKICSILPGMKSPTVLPLRLEGWSSVHTVIQEDKFWEIIEALKQNGAEGIIVVPIEKMIF